MEPMKGGRCFSSSTSAVVTVTVAEKLVVGGGGGFVDAAVGISSDDNILTFRFSGVFPRPIWRNSSMDCRRSTLVDAVSVLAGVVVVEVVVDVSTSEIVTSPKVSGSGSQKDSLVCVDTCFQRSKLARPYLLIGRRCVSWPPNVGRPSVARTQLDLKIGLAYWANLLHFRPKTGIYQVTGDQLTSALPNDFQGWFSFQPGKISAISLAVFVGRSPRHSAQWDSALQYMKCGTQHNVSVVYAECHKWVLYAEWRGSVQRTTLDHAEQTGLGKFIISYHYNIGNGYFSILC